MNLMNGKFKQIKTSIDEKPSLGSDQIKRESEYNSIKLDAIYDKE